MASPTAHGTAAARPWTRSRTSGEALRVCAACAAAAASPQPAPAACWALRHAAAPAARCLLPQHREGRMRREAQVRAGCRHRRSQRRPLSRQIEDTVCPIRVRCRRWRAHRLPLPPCPRPCLARRHPRVAAAASAACALHQPLPTSSHRGCSCVPPPSPPPPDPNVPPSPPSPPPSPPPPPPAPLQCARRCAVHRAGLVPGVPCPHAAPNCQLCRCARAPPQPGLRPACCRPPCPTCGREAVIPEGEPGTAVVRASCPYPQTINVVSAVWGSAYSNCGTGDTVTRCARPAGIGASPRAALLPTCLPARPPSNIPATGPPCTAGCGSPAKTRRAAPPCSCARSPPAAPGPAACSSPIGQRPGSARCSAFAVWRAALRRACSCAAARRWCCGRRCRLCWLPLDCATQLRVIPPPPLALQVPRPSGKAPSRAALSAAAAWRCAPRLLQQPARHPIWSHAFCVQATPSRAAGWDRGWCRLARRALPLHRDISKRKGRAGAGP